MLLAITAAIVLYPAYHSQAADLNCAFHRLNENTSCPASRCQLQAEVSAHHLVTSEKQDRSVSCHFAVNRERQSNFTFAARDMKPGHFHNPFHPPFPPSFLLNNAFLN